MKLLTHSEIVKLIEDAFEAGYQAGSDNADGMLHTQSSFEYVNKALNKIGEPEFSVTQR